jgi:ligand-binding SRPBCC domain-containing protein
MTLGPIEMKPGTRIDYRLRLHGIPLRWQSEITTWEPPHRFVDQQRRGPYPLWVHEHTFLEQYGGTLARDHVEYKVPGGSLINRLLVRPDLEKIFKYRHQRLDLVFKEGKHGMSV